MSAPLLSAVFLSLSNEDEESSLTPVITDDGITFIYIKHNNLYRQQPTRWTAAATLTSCLRLTHSFLLSPTAVAVALSVCQ
jgi:hypothetical protein